MKVSAKYSVEFQRLAELHFAFLVNEFNFRLAGKAWCRIVYDAQLISFVVFQRQLGDSVDVEISLKADADAYNLQAISNFAAVESPQAFASNAGSLNIVLGKIAEFVHVYAQELLRGDKGAFKVLRAATISHDREYTLGFEDGDRVDVRKAFRSGDYDRVVEALSPRRSSLSLPELKMLEIAEGREKSS